MSIPPTINRCRYCLGSLFAFTAVAAACLSAGFSLAQGNAYTPPAPPAVQWESNIDTALARAEREQRPLFLHIIGNDCLPAQQMAVEVFSNPNIIAQLNANFVALRINASENPALAQKFAVTQIPTDLVIKPNGQLLHRRTGGITAERFTDYLAFLQNTIQADRNQTLPVHTAPPADSPAAGPSPAVNPAASPPLQSIPSSIGVQPGAGTPRETVSAPQNATNDPFLNQAQSTQHQPPVIQQPVIHQPVARQETMVPPPGGNPLRTAEQGVRPAMEQALAVDQAANPSFMTGVPPVPPPSVSPPSIAAVMDEEPAPAKKTVEVPLALEGFCAVTLCTEERWVSGNPAYYIMFQGHIFRFATVEAMTAFARNPLNYVPIAMGEDIVLIVDRSKRVNGNRNFGACFQGRVFLFSSQESFDAFKARPDFYTEIALKYEVARRDHAIPLVY